MGLRLLMMAGALLVSLQVSAESELGCFTALRGVALSPNLTTGDGALSFVPARREGHEGFYLVENETQKVAFYRLPHAPKENDVTPFYLKIKTPSQQALTLTYTFKPTEEGIRGEVSFAALDAPDVTYHVVHAERVSFESVRSAFHEVLDQMVRTVEDSFRLSQTLYSGIIDFPSWKDYQARLGTCAEVKNQALQKHVAFELAMLEKLRPVEQDAARGLASEPAEEE